MRKIDIGSRKGPKQLTVMAVGSSRAGKTHFASTFPRPLLLCDASEHGWTTADFMDPDFYYEKDRPPQAIGIESPTDMMKCLVALQKQARGEKVDLDEWPLAQGKWEVGTVVCDSLTFYADAYFNMLELEHAGKKTDKRQLYGDLQAHLRHLMIQFHALPYNIIWTALASINEDSTQRGALIMGSTAAKAPARTDLWVYLDKSERAREGGKTREVSYDMYTQSALGFKAGHRFGNLLPDVMDPEYAAIEEALGIEPWTARLAPKTKTTNSKSKNSNRPQANQ